LKCVLLVFMCAALSACLLDENPNRSSNNRTNGSGSNNQLGEVGSSCLEDEDCLSGLICKQLLCDHDVPSERHYVLVQDTSETCDATLPDPGSDFMSMRVESSTGRHLGWAEVVDYLPNGEFEYNNAFSIMNGTGGRFYNTCPESFETDIAFSLGCGGRFVALFRNTDGLPVRLRRGQTLVTWEWGSQCGGSFTDTYEIYVCTDSEAAAVADYSSCTILAGSGSGITYSRIP